MVHSMNSPATTVNIVI